MTIAIAAIIVIVLAVISGYFLTTRPAQVPPAKEVLFTFQTSGNIPTIDPGISLGYPDSTSVQNLYDPLLIPKADPPFEAVPWLAESYKVSSDGLVYTMTLKQGVKFHDGTELTADDVAFSMDRYMRIKRGHAFLWLGFIDVGMTKAVSKYVVEFNLKSPLAPFVPSLTKFMVVNKNLLLSHKAPGDFGDLGDLGQKWLSEANDAGSGPYKIVAYNRDQGIEMVKFKDYWGGWKANQIDRIKWKVISEEATAKFALIKGEVDMIDNWLSPATYKELQGQAGIQVVTGPSTWTTYIDVHTTKPPTDDLHVRRALTMAIPYDELMKTIWAGGVRGKGAVPVLVPGSDPNIKPYEYDLSKAKQELAQSKYTTKELSNYEIEYVWLEGQETERILGVALQSSAAQLGLNVKVVGMPFSTLIDRVKKPETSPHLSSGRASTRYPDPDPFFYLFHSSAAGTFRGEHWWFSPERDKLIEKTRSIADPAERLKVMYEFQETIVDQVPRIIPVNPPFQVAMRDYVKGFKISGSTAWEYWFYRLTISPSTAQIISPIVPLGISAGCVDLSYSLTVKPPVIEFSRPALG